MMVSTMTPSLCSSSGPRHYTQGLWWDFKGNLVSMTIFTLVAFVWLFSIVLFQMCPQMVCPRGCKVTLVAFVCDFSSVCFQMNPWMAWLMGCIVTLVAFMWLNDIVSILLQYFYISILQTKLIIFTILLHCHCVLCLCQMVDSNWVFQSPIIAIV